MAQMSWRDRWRGWRNRLIADPSFRRAAGRSSIGRAIASHEASALFDIGAGFVYAQCLLACVRLGLLSRLAAGPQSLAGLAKTCDLPEPAMLTLLRAAAALRLVELFDTGEWGLGAQGAAFIGTPGLDAMIEHHALLYADLADPVALLRTGGGGRLAEFWGYRVAAEPAARAWSGLMAATQGMVADTVLDAVSLKQRSRLLDVGGGSGAFAEAALRRHVHLSATVFDLPPVAALARARFAGLGMGARADAVGGDFFADSLPAGADVVSLVRVLHDHDDAPALALLRQARRALAPGGLVIIAEPMAGTRGAVRVGDAYFGLYLAAMGRGRPRSDFAYRAMLAEAGFHRVRERRSASPVVVRVLTAEPA